MTIQQVFEVAVQHHHSGRLADAEALYRQILATQPGHAEARHFLGVIAYQMGRPELAVDLITQAISLDPGNATAFRNLGEAWRVLGRLDDAVASLRRALQLEPNSAESHRRLGFLFAEQRAWEEAIASYRRAVQLQSDDAAAHDRMGNKLEAAGQFDEAQAAHRQALQLQPDMAQTHNSLGVVLAACGRTEESMAAFRRALELNPASAETQCNLGNALQLLGQSGEASAAYRRALEIQPGCADAHNNLGAALAAQGQLDEAMAAYRRALEIKPGYAEAHHNLGVALAGQERFEEALASYHRALDLNPSAPDIHNNLGNAFQSMGRLDEAIATYRQAICLQPDVPDYHWNHALALFRNGRWKEAWEEYEWRVKRPHLARPDLTAPPWNGEDLAGRTLLIHQEGGFGDVIHFIRYLPMVLARHPARIIFEGGAPILSLMNLQPGIAGTVARGQPLPAHHYHCPPPSFPRLFGTELHSIPAEIPYLAVDQEKQSAWRRKLSAPPYQEGARRQFLVGLNWAGSDVPFESRSRTLRTFAPLAQVPNVTFVSLQKGPEAAQAADVPPGMRLIDAAAGVGDFSELAALVSCLDAVASVDTSVAHLGGALGIPTWILLPTQPDSRWLTSREDSPWYPTVHLFRQQHFRSWDEPVQQMASVLRSHAESALQP